MTDLTTLAKRIEPILYQHFVTDCVSDHTVNHVVEAAKKIAAIVAGAVETLPRAIEIRLAEGAASMAELKAAGRAFDPKATDKQIYNALTMLVRYNRAERAGYGRYRAPMRQTGD